jgi:hypothetical protein
MNKEGAKILDENNVFNKFVQINSYVNNNIYRCNINHKHSGNCHPYKNVRQYVYKNIAKLEHIIEFLIEHFDANHKISHILSMISIFICKRINILRMVTDNLDIIYLLLNKCPNWYINRIDNNGKSLLFRLPYFLDKHYFEILKYLVDKKGLNLNTKYNDFNLLDSIIMHNIFDKKIFKYVLDNWNINLTNDDIDRYVWHLDRNNNIEKNKNGEYDIIIWIKNNYPIFDIWMDML